MQEKEGRVFSNQQPRARQASSAATAQGPVRRESRSRAASLCATGQGRVRAGAEVVRERGSSFAIHSETEPERGLFAEGQGERPPFFPRCNQPMARPCAHFTRGGRAWRIALLLHRRGAGCPCPSYQAREPPKETGPGELLAPKLLLIASCCCDIQGTIFGRKRGEACPPAQPSQAPRQPDTRWTRNTPLSPTHTPTHSPHPFPPKLRPGMISGGGQAPKRLTFLLIFHFGGAGF